jgi:hypothetical protein
VWFLSHIKKVDPKFPICYNTCIVIKKELEMTLRYETVGEMITQNEQQKSIRAAVGRDMQRQRQINMYGCTEQDLRDSVESSITFKTSGPAMIVASMMSDAQEMMAYEKPSFATIESQRQLLNRAKFVLFEYIMDKQNG